MAKNIPITARVSRGLFGQKATEPVLNVGQAGVYGNNVTKGDPSPAKMMMKSPFKQVKSESAGDKIPKAQATVAKGDPSRDSSPLKQVKSEGAGDKILKGQASVKTSSPGVDKVVKGGTKVIPGEKYVPNENKWWDSLSPQQKAEHNKKKRAEIAKDPKYQPKTIQEPDRIEKGQPTETKEPLTIFNEGSAKTSFWRRQDDRSVTHTSRKKKKADIQLAKLEAKQGYTTSVDKDGKEVKTAITDKSKHVKEAKLKAKKEMWESRQAGYQGSRDAAIKQSQQSTRIHGTVKGVNLDPKGQQILHANQIGNKPGYTTEADAKTQGRAIGGFDVSEAPKTQNTNTELTNPATNAPAGSAANTKSVEVKAAEKLGPEITVEKKTPQSQMTEDDTPLEKKANGFFAKKSPLKMKYFK